ncbi:MAG: hypothetical protein ACK4UT_06550 [Moraxellaceae bacterium]
MMDLLFTPAAYAQLFRNHIRLQVPARGIVLEQTATFSHPRMLLGDFNIAEACLGALLKKAYPSRLLPARPLLVMHPCELLEGGLSKLEERALTELGLGAGAREVRLWTGAPLDADALERLLAG